VILYGGPALSSILLYKKQFLFLKHIFIEIKSIQMNLK